MDQVLDSFWQIASSDEVSATPQPPEFNLSSVVARQRDLQQIYFAMAWPAPAYTDPNRYSLHVFSSMFGGGPTSRLYQQLREEQGLVYHVSSQYQAYGNTGALVVEGATLPHTLVPVLAGTLIEMIKISQTDIDPDDHHRAVQSIISQHLVSGDSAYVRMSRLSLQELYFGRAVGSEEVIEALQAQSPEMMRQIASETYGAGLPTIALTGPVTDEILQATSDMLHDFGTPSEVAFTPEHTITTPQALVGTD